MNKISFQKKKKYTRNEKFIASSGRKKYTNKHHNNRSDAEIVESCRHARVFQRQKRTTTYVKLQGKTFGGYTFLREVHSDSNHCRGLFQCHFGFKILTDISRVMRDKPVGCKSCAAKLREGTD